MAKKEICQHGYDKEQYNGETVFVQYYSWFCPDCGQRIEKD